MHTELMEPAPTAPNLPDVDDVSSELNKQFSIKKHQQQQQSLANKNKKKVSSLLSSSSFTIPSYRSSLIFLLACFGILFIIIGLILYLAVLHSFLHRIISEKLVLAEGSETYEKWRSIPMPVYYRYYFFNVTNPIEVERSGAKPIVEEIGPFTYRSQWIKHPIKFHKNGTVSFRERKTMEFVRELSFASDRAKIIRSINGPLTITLALLQKAPIVVRNIVMLGLSTVTEGFFVQRSARELLFDGYPEMLTSFGPLLNPTIPNTKGRFGWLYGRNNTDDGLFTVFTGRDDITKINQIDRYNGKTELNYWKPKSHCNRLQGTTDGQLIATNEERTFDLFHPELCRKIRFIAEETALNSSHFLTENFSKESGQDPSDIKFTVDRYVPELDTLSSMDDYPMNSCYKSQLTPSRPELGDLLSSIRRNNENQSRFQIRPFFRNKNGRIIFRSGVFDMSECKYGAPVLFSYPHFLHAHPNYRENIEGLRPDRKLHQFHMMVEPVTGTSLRSYARVQINVYISKPPFISRFRNMPELVFPIFWQELSAEASNDMIEHINWALTKPFIYADVFSITLIIIGLILVAISGYCMLPTINSKQIKQTKSTPITLTQTMPPTAFENQAMQHDDDDYNDDHTNNSDLIPSKDNLEMNRKIPMAMVNEYTNMNMLNSNKTTESIINNSDHCGSSSNSSYQNKSLSSSTTSLSSPS